MNKRFVKHLLLLGLLQPVVQMAVAQQHVTVQIVDREQQPADAATVVVTDVQRKRVVKNQIADAEGTIGMTLDNGEYQLYVTSLGYKDAVRNITVPCDRPLLKIVIEADVTRLDDVVVTARQRRPIARMEEGRISIDVAQSYLADLGNAIDVLKHSPGIRVDSKGGISLSSLGGTAVYVNGKKIRLQGEALTAYLRSLPSTKIRKITTSANPNAAYESEGAGGIIDITLNEHTDTGFYLTTSHGLAYWKHVGSTSDLALSYNRDKWQIALNYNHSIGHCDMRYGSDRIQNGQRNFLNTLDTDKRNTYAGGIDFVFRPNDKHKLAVNASADAVIGPGITITETQIYDKVGALKQTLHAENDYVRQRNLKYGIAASYVFTPEKRQTLRLDADYIRMNGLSDCNQPNTYYRPDGKLERSDLYHSSTDRHIDILSLTADYKIDIGLHDRLLIGVKTARVGSDNNFSFYANNRFDNSRSNMFKYTETNLESYLQYTLQRDKWTATTGLRIEYMHTDGRLRAYDASGQHETDRNNRSSLFPNLSVTYQAARNTRLTLAYSKRQDKPRYEDLNPFEYLLDELTYWKGNPFIKPQTCHKLMFSLAYKQLGLTLSYNRLNDYFTSLTDVYRAGTVVMTTKNIGRQQQLGLEAVYSRRFATWWDVNANIGAFYFVNQLDYEHYQSTYRRPSFTFSLSNDIKLPADLRFELTAHYRSKRQGNSYETLASAGNIDAGLSRSFAKDRLKLSLVVTDLLHTERWDSHGLKDQLDLSSWFQSETRRIIFKLRYSLGVRKFNETKRIPKEAERL